MAFEGEVIGRVATHRRHHAFADRPGDPHSPYRYGTHLAGQPSAKLLRITGLDRSLTICPICTAHSP
jgi:hypothetical protein